MLLIYRPSSAFFHLVVKLILCTILTLILPQIVLRLKILWTYLLNPLMVLYILTLQITLISLIQFFGLNLCYNVLKVPSPDIPIYSPRTPSIPTPPILTPTHVHKTEKNKATLCTYLWRVSQGQRVLKINAKVDMTQSVTRM